MRLASLHSSGRGLVPIMSMIRIRIRLVALGVLLAIATSLSAGSAEEVRDAEIAFAKAFAEHNEAKFFSFVLDDASFLGGARTLRGKQEVVERWSRFFKAPQPPFAWTPERVAVNAAGTIGLSTGPVVDAKGHLVGTFNSVWIKQADGSWKVLFDGPGGSVACLAESAVPSKEGDISVADGTTIHYKTVGDGPFQLIAPAGLVLQDDFKALGDLATICFYGVRARVDPLHPDQASSPSIEQDVKNLEAVREFFKIEKFVPVGFSNAALVAEEYAVQHPERVSRLIEIAPEAGKYPETDLSKVTMPVLTILSTQDPVTPYSAARARSERLPNGRFVTIRGSEHALWRTDSPNVFAAVRQFLRGEWPLSSEKITAAQPQ